MCYYKYSLEDAFNGVEFFNRAFGGVPEGGLNPESDEFFAKVKSQTQLILDEVNELGESIEERDKVNLLKEACDVAVTLFGLIDLLSKSGYNVASAMEHVNENNLSKLMDFEEDAIESVGFHMGKGVESYVDSKVIDGDTYYSVRRKSDGKALKPYNYKACDVSRFVPDSH